VFGVVLLGCGFRPDPDPDPDLDLDLRAVPRNLSFVVPAQAGTQ
jgi:hypothetical protein